MLRGQVSRPDHTAREVIALREIAAAVVKFDHFFERSKAAVMHVWAAKLNISKAGRSKFAAIIIVAGDRESAGILALRPHAYVVEAVVGEPFVGMTETAIITGEKIEAALFSAVSGAMPEFAISSGVRSENSVRS